MAAQYMHQKLEQAEIGYDGSVMWYQSKICLKCRVGGLRTEQRAGRLVLMSGTKPHKCRPKSKKN